MDYGRKFLFWSLIYAAAGMGLGLFMGATENPSQYDAHAHILLVGFVVSFIYAVIHQLWLKNKPSRLAYIQFILHQAGAVVMFLALLMVNGGVMPSAQLAPVLGIASVAVFASVLLMIFMVSKVKDAKSNYQGK